MYKFVQYLDKNLQNKLDLTEGTLTPFEQSSVDIRVQYEEVLSVYVVTWFFNEVGTMQNNLWMCSPQTDNTRLFLLYDLMHIARCIHYI